MHEVFCLATCSDAQSDPRYTAYMHACIHMTNQSYSLVSVAPHQGLMLTKLLTPEALPRPAQKTPKHRKTKSKRPVNCSKKPQEAFQFQKGVKINSPLLAATESQSKAAVELHATGLRLNSTTFKEPCKGAEIVYGHNVILWLLYMLKFSVSSFQYSSWC